MRIHFLSNKQSQKNLAKFQSIKKNFLTSNMKISLTYSVNDIPDIGTTIRSPFRNFQRGRRRAERKHRCGHAPKQKSHLSLSLFGIIGRLFFSCDEKSYQWIFSGIRVVRGRWKRKKSRCCARRGNETRGRSCDVHEQSSSPKSPRGVRDTARNAGLASNNWRRSCFNQLVAEWG